MDRVAPTKRPIGKNAGRQRWEELLFVHWRVPKDAVRALVPRRLELDLWDDDAWIGVVPFLMRDIAPSWLPKAFAFNFLECNVRTYVHHDGEPGVYFFSLEASSWLAVQAARVGWGLPYHHAKMSSTREGDVTHYRSRRRSNGASLETRFRVGDAIGPSAPDTLEHFFLERYLLFSEMAGRLMRGQVHHPPYPARRAELLELQEDLLAAAGLPRPDEKPELVHYAPAVDVEVFAPRPI